MLLDNSQMLFPGNRSVISSPNFTASPRSPLDIKSPSSKRYDYGGIGLGIVAALEKSCNGFNRHVISSIQHSVCFSGSGSNRSDPVHCAEEYTCVTSRYGLTKVYYNDVEFELCRNVPDGNHRDRICNKSTDVAEESPANKRDICRDSPDFLTACCLCKKQLKGNNIYMYKGDKGFCSEECRSVKIMEDNLKNCNVNRKVLKFRDLCTPAEIFTLPEYL